MTTATATKTGRYRFGDLVRASKGRAVEILKRVAGIPAEYLDGKHHPCPKCQGKDRFRLIDADKGAVLCNKCLKTDNGNFIQAVAWMRDCPYDDAMRLVAEYLGIIQDDDIVAAVARDKGMPLEAFKQFGAEAAKRGKLPVARVPLYDHQGEQHSYFDLVPGKKGWAKKGQGTSGMYFPGRLPQPGETWLLAEGVKDPAALVGLGYLAAGMWNCTLARKYARLFTGCHIILVHDLDTAGVDGAGTTGGRLVKTAASVRVARLPGDIVESGGADVRDILRGPDGEKLVRTAIDGAMAWTPPAEPIEDTQPTVIVGMDEAAVAQEVISALGGLGWGDDRDQHLRIYQRIGVLVEVVRSINAVVCGVELPDDMYRIRPLPASILRERITSAVRLKLPSEDDDDDGEYIRPPQWLVNAIHQRGQYPRVIRPLAGIIRCPTLRPDGTVLQTPGYDAATGLLFLPDGRYPPIPDHPSQPDARRAADELLEVVCDFPFQGDDHRSGWLALVLTLVGRSAIRGACPLFVIDANTPGTGKSLLSDAAGLIAYGHDLSRKGWPGDDDEVRKTITAVALEALSAVLWDNIGSTLGCSSLDAALTGTSWHDRILGTNTTTGTLPLTTVWVATGNNIVLGADTARRTLYSRVESLLENPEERPADEFRHADLLGWVKEHRHRLAAAAVTVLRGFMATGNSRQSIPPWGSFEAWSKLVRSSIVWCGLPDPAGTRAMVRAADRSAELLRLVLDGIREVDSGDGVTTSEVLRLLSHPLKPDEVDDYPTLRAAVAELCGQKVDSRSLGNKLRGYRDRVAGGRRLVNQPGHGGVKRWSVEEVSTGGCGGSGGSFSLSTRVRDDSISPPQETEIHDVQKVELGKKDPPHQPHPPSNGHCSCGGVWDVRTESDGKTRRFCSLCYQFGGFQHADGSWRQEQPAV